MGLSIDRQKVIEELDKLADEVNPWKESPPLRCDIPYPLLCDALFLLKEQEPKKVEWRIGRAHCPSCGELFPRKKETQYIRFCSFCGQAVKWDDSD